MGKIISEDATDAMMKFLAGENINIRVMISPSHLYSAYDAAVGHPDCKSYVGIGTTIEKALTDFIDGNGLTAPYLVDGAMREQWCIYFEPLTLG